MRIIVLGDGYLGWTAMHLAARGHEVWTVDNYLRRQIALETCSEALIPTPISTIGAHLPSADRPAHPCHDRRLHQSRGHGRAVRRRVGCGDPLCGAALRAVLDDGLRRRAAHPRNNLEATVQHDLGLLEHAPECHIVKLGTMGEYGTPNIDIEEGWLEIEHKGRKDKFLYPRAAGTLYHTTKVLDTDLLWFYVRLYGLTVTDLMQGPVYGLVTPESELDDRLLPNFHYDDIFGTVVNRFLVQGRGRRPADRVRRRRPDPRLSQSERHVAMH